MRMDSNKKSRKVRKSLLLVPETMRWNMFFILLDESYIAKVVNILERRRGYIVQWKL